MRKSLSAKQCRTILADEAEAVEMYNRLGFPKQAAQEAEHFRFFQAQCRGRGKR